MKNGKLIFAAVALSVIATCGVGMSGETNARDMFKIFDDTNIVTEGELNRTAYKALKATPGVSDKQAKMLVYTGSKGTFMPAFRHLSNNATGQIGALGEALPRITSTGKTVVNSYNAASGQWAGSATMAAGATTAYAVGGEGGEIQKHLVARHNESDKTGGKSNTIASIDGLASSAVNCGFANRIWISPFYVNQDMDQRNGYTGYKYDAVGATIGYDRTFGALTLGAAVTYSRGDYSEKGVRDDNTIDNYGASIYLDYYTGPGFTFNLNAGYNYGDNDLKRLVDFEYDANAGNDPADIRRFRGYQKGSNHTNTYWAGGNVGYQFQIAECLKLTPSVGLFWTESRGTSFNANGVLGRQNFGKMTDKALIAPVDLNLEYTRQLSGDSSFTFRVGGGYSYNFKDDGLKGKMTYGYADALPITIQGVKPGHSSWNANIGMKYRFSRFDVGVDYRYDGKSDYNQHRVSGTFGISF